MKKIIISIIIGNIILSCSSDKVLQTKQIKMPTIKYDSKANNRFGKSIRFKTYWDQEGNMNPKEFEEFISFLKKSFPLTHKYLTVEKINKFSLLYKWKGKNSNLKPNMISAHYDVVPAKNVGDWMHPPFKGVITKSHIWGRGTLDDKFSVMATLEAIENLLKEKFTPESDWYFGIGHDEEIMGVQGGLKIAKTLKARKVKLNSLLDEGPSLLTGQLPKRESLTVGYIGIATKGHVYIKISAKGPGGHASMPPLENPIVELAKAMSILKDLKLKEELGISVKKTISEMLPLFTGVEKFVLSNPNLFSYFIISDFMKKRSSRSLVKEDISFNIMSAGDKDATVPKEAHLIISTSLLPGSNYNNRLNRIKEKLAHLSVIVEPVKFKHNKISHMYNPTSTSSIKSKAYNSIKKSIKATYGEILILPTLMPGGSDGKHYKNNGVVEDVYYFNPLHLTEEELNAFHAVDERISIDSYNRSILFYKSYIKEMGRPNYQISNHLF